jgi:hypothetical protein
MTKDVTDFDALDTGAACEKSYEFELVHPTNDKPLGVFISTLGPESQAFKNRVRKEVNRDRKRQFEATRKNKPIEPQTLEEDEEFGVSLLAEQITGWRTVKDNKSEPVIYWKGEKLEFNKDNVLKWLMHFPWARKQISEESSKLENFLGNLQTAS